MNPKSIIEKWVNAFNKAYVQTLKNLYAVDARNHQMPNQAIIGRNAIEKCFMTNLQWLLKCIAYRFR